MRWLELFRAEIAQGRVEPGSIVVHIDVVEGVRLGLLAPGKVFALDGVDLEVVVPALRGCVVVAVASGTHSGDLAVASRSAAVRTPWWRRRLTGVLAGAIHVMQHANKALNAVRIREARALAQEGDTTLKGSRQLWLYAAENVPSQRQADFEALKSADLHTARAWAAKEEKLEPIIRYYRHPISNGKAEGVNSQLMAIQRSARGFRSHASFRIAALFHCGGLDLYPRICQAHVKS